MSAPSHVGHLALVAFAALVALSPLSLGGCGRRDDGSIAADPDAKLRAGFPVIYVAPPVPTNPGAPAPSNPLAMNALKHDAPASASASAMLGADSEPIDPCALKDPKGPLAMRLRHDGPADPNRRNPLCMRLK